MPLYLSRHTLLAMSKIGLILWLVIALILGIAVLIVLNRQPTQSDQPNIILPIDPASVSTLTITTPQHQRRFIRTQSGLWMHQLVDKDQTISSTWLTDSRRIRAALRLLNSTRGQPRTKGPSEAEHSSWTKVQIQRKQNNEDRVTLWISPKSLAGSHHARIQMQNPAEIDALITIDSNLASLFLNNAPALWLDAHALALLPEKTDVITIQTDNQTLSLRQRGSRWQLDQPIQAAAEPVMVERLKLVLSHLLSDTIQLKANHSLDLEPALESSMKIQITANAPAFTKAQGNAVWTLTIGQATSLSAASVHAVSIVTDAERSTILGPAHLTIERAALSAIELNPASYIAKKTSRLPRADVAWVELHHPANNPTDTLRINRQIQGWVSESDHATDAIISRLGVLLMLVCDLPAETVHLDNAAGFEPLVGIKLGGLSDTIIDTMKLGIWTDPVSSSSTSGKGQPEPRLAVISGSILRIFDKKTTDEVLGWLTVLSQSLEP